MQGNPDEEQESCSKCDSTGYFCIECDEADGNCSCSDGPELMPCDLCGEEGEDE